MHKNTKWANQILALQKPDGSWGNFHSLSVKNSQHITTEQALRRLKILGYTIQDPSIERAVSYMQECLCHRKEIPDRREKILSWDIFVSMMLAAWIREFTKECPQANQIAESWTKILQKSFASGEFSSAAYNQEYENQFDQKPCGGRLKDFVSFYQVSLAADCLGKGTQFHVVSHILHHPSGIYYVYEQPLNRLPNSFTSKQAVKYLAAIELLAKYRYGRKHLGFVRDWLIENQLDHGEWDMGPQAKDGVWFPLSDTWRKEEFRRQDCTERIKGLLSLLHTEE